MGKAKTICLRLYPTGPADKYLNGGKIRNVGFQIIARNENQIELIDTLQYIADKLDAMKSDTIVSSNGSFELINCNITTELNFVERDNQGWVYTALFNAELFIK